MRFWRIYQGLGVAGLWTVLAPMAAANTYLYDRDQMKVFILGIAELDVFHDSTRSLYEAVGNGPIAAVGSRDGDLGRTQMSARNSRLAFGMETLRGGWLGKGLVEFDFSGYQPSSAAERDLYQNATGRLRIAYLQAERDGWSVLAGMDWTLFGWQSEYVASTVSVRPNVGAAYERIPQFRVTKEWALGDDLRWQLAGAVERPVQREAGLPNIAAGTRIKWDTGRLAPYTSAQTGDVKAEGASFGISGTLRQLAHPQAANSSRETHLLVGAVAVDARYPLLSVAKGEDVGNTLAAVAEWTKGSGYGDVFTGWTGNIKAPAGAPGKAGVQASEPNIDTGIAGYRRSDGGFRAVQLQSWQGSLQYHAPAEWRSWATFGAAELWSENAADLVPQAAAVIYTRAQGVYVNAVHNFNREVRVGVEYSRNRVRYVDQRHGVNHRVECSTWYRF